MRAIKFDPRQPAAQFHLGTTYYKLGRNKEAIHYLKEAVRLKPAYAEAQYNLGILLLCAGQRDAALRQYQTLKTLHPNLAQNLYAVLYRDLILSAKQQ